MRIAGIDPGFHRCGFAVLERAAGGSVELLQSGVLVTKRGEPLWQRLSDLARQLEQMLLLWRPEHVAVEEIYFAKNAKTAIDVAQARGVILERSCAAGHQVFEYAPSTVKSQLTGNGQAEKSQVAYMVRRMISLPEDAAGTRRLDDELDAIAVALCHAQRVTIPEVMR